MGENVISAAITPLSLEIMKSCQRYDFESQVIKMNRNSPGGIGLKIL